MPKNQWSVIVRMNGRRVLSIFNDRISGSIEPGSLESEAVRLAGENLLARLSPPAMQEPQQGQLPHAR